MCVCVADKDKGPQGKVKVVSGVHILPLELTDGDMTAGKYAVVDSGKVGWV